MTATEDQCRHASATAVGWWDGKKGKKTVRGRTFYCPDCKCVMYRPHEFKGQLWELEAFNDDTAKLISELDARNGA